MLHELLDAMCGPITEILKKSFNLGVLPRDWLDAIVTPVFKKCNQNKAENYRPISLTCIICKVLESIIKNISSNTSWIRNSSPTNSMVSLVVVQHQLNFLSSYMIASSPALQGEWYMLYILILPKRLTRCLIGD